MISQGFFGLSFKLSLTLIQRVKGDHEVWIQD